MGRKSLAGERKEQCLDAFERAIVEVGFVGATLDVVADRAGVHRTIIRHYFGRKENLVEALLTRMGARYAERYRYADTLEDPQRRLTRVLGAMFAHNESGQPTLDQVFDSLYAARDHEPRVSEFLREFYRDATRRLVRLVQLVHPNARPDDVRQAAAALLGLAVGHSILDSIEPSRSRTARLRRAASAVLAALEA